MTFDKQTTIRFSLEEEQILQKAEAIINELYESIEENEMLEIGKKNYTAEEIEELRELLFALTQGTPYFVEVTEK